MLLWAQPLGGDALSTISVFCPEWLHRHQTRYSAQPQRGNCSQAQDFLPNVSNVCPSEKYSIWIQHSVYSIPLPEDENQEKSSLPVLLLCITVSNQMGRQSPFKKEKIQMSILGNSHPSHSIRDTQGTLSLWDLTWRFTPHPTSLFYCLWWHYALRFSSSKWGFYLKPSLLQEISLKNTFLGKNVADYLLTSKTCRCSEQKVQILLVWPRKRHPLKFRNTGHQIVEGKE